MAGTTPDTATATPYVFSSAEHAHLTPYLAALHASCVTHDHMVGTFVPPLNHEKLLAWWKDRIAEANAGSRSILLLLLESQPGARAKGPELVGVAMLANTPPSETGAFRGRVEELLVSPKYRRRGGATALMDVLEAEAMKRGKTLLMLDVESGSAAEDVFRKLGYVEIGKVPRYGRNPTGTAKDQTFFYKDLVS